ncbi:MAG: sulfatase-like hydrolase/transferase [Vicinamibacterales bacterium]
MSRRPFRYTLILASVGLGTALAAVGGWRYARASAPLNGPVILISVDSLRPDHLPAYGYRKVKTPAIDELAGSGVVFDRAFAHAPQTLPSHVALLSGRLPFETGVRDDVGVAVKPGERLLARMLRDRGYATGGVVSSSLLRQATGIDQGFDFFDAEIPIDPSAPTADPRQRDGARSEEIAEHWLETVQDARSFLLLHLNEPHKPYTPPDRFSQYSPYDGEIAYADEIIGRLIHYLKAHQLYDRSTIVLLADHGEGLGDHGEQEHGLFLYDETMRVPLIIKQEGNARAGTRVSDVAQLVDVVPTILDLVKAPTPGNLRGRSLKPLLDGGARRAEPAVYSEAMYGRLHFGWSELTSVTDGRHRYIKAPREELYDLVLDPKERENLMIPGPREDRANPANPVNLGNPGNLVDALDRLTADTTLGEPGPADATPPADPKDRHQTLETYRRAVELANAAEWPQAIMLLQQIVRDHQELTEVWSQLARSAYRIERYDVALGAYRRVAELRPAEPAGSMGAAEALVKLKKLEEARVEAARAADIATDRASRVAAHELLVRIALARHDAAAARAEAELVREGDPRVPMPAYVDGRLLYDRGRYVDALPLFEQALGELKASGGPPMTDLHYYTAATLDRLARQQESEAEFLEELRHFPGNIQARGGLAALYHATGRPDEADRVLSEMIGTRKDPESYSLAARLWQSFGKIRQAAAIRAEARKTFSSAN